MVIAVLLQTLLVSRVSVLGVTADLFLILTVVVAVSRGSMEGAIFGFFAGLVADIAFFQPLGVRALIYVLVGYFVGMFVARFGTVSPWAVLLLAGSASFAAQFVFGLFQYMMGPRAGFPHHGRHPDDPGRDSRCPGGRPGLRVPGPSAAHPGSASRVRRWAGAGRNDPASGQEEAASRGRLVRRHQGGRAAAHRAGSLRACFRSACGSCRSSRATNTSPTHRATGCGRWWSRRLGGSSTTATARSWWRTGRV